MKSRSLRGSLSAKLLVMTILFVMVAEVLIFAPSVARFRESWLEGRMAAGHLAALTIEAAPDQLGSLSLTWTAPALNGGRAMVEWNRTGSYALDPGNAERLWEVSTELVQGRPADE